MTIWNDKTNRELIEKLMEEINDQGKNLGDCVNMMRTNQLDEKRVQILARILDNEITKRDMTKANNSFAMEYVYIGWFLLIIGLFLTIGAYLQWISFGNFYIIAYGPILVGFGLIIANYAKMR